VACCRVIFPTIRGCEPVMGYYENVFIVRQDMSPAQVEGLADNYATLIEENGGKVLKREHWGLKSLAYRIKKNRKGHYVMFDVEANSDAVNELERQMRLSEDVIRFMTVKIDEVTEAPSPMMSRRDRDDRRRSRDDRDDDFGDDGDDMRGRADDDSDTIEEENS
jgi:small subunit ribosomal protein S6